MYEVSGFKIDWAEDLLNHRKNMPLKIKLQTVNQQESDETG